MIRWLWIPVFLAGVLLGALAQRWFGLNWRRHPPKPEAVAAKLARELKLDEGQHAKVLQAVRDFRTKMTAQRAKTRGEFEALRKESRERLRTLLKPEQQPRFDELAAKWEARHKRDWEGPGGPPPP